MIYPYVILPMVIMVTPLLAMNKDKKENNSSKVTSYSFHMEPVLSEIRANLEKKEASVTYRYSDGSKTTYYRYKNSYPKD